MPATPHVTIGPHRCPTCGTAVDPLRAGAVALLPNASGEAHDFVYFCSRSCRQASAALSLPPPPVVPKAATAAKEPPLRQVRQDAGEPIDTPRSEPGEEAPIGRDQTEPASVVVPQGQPREVAAEARALSLPLAARDETGTAVVTEAEAPIEVAPPVAAFEAPAARTEGRSVAEIAPEREGDGAPPARLGSGDEVSMLVRALALLVASVAPLLGLLGLEFARLSGATLASTLLLLLIVLGELWPTPPNNLRMRLRRELQKPPVLSTVLAFVSVLWAWHAFLTREHAPSMAIASYCVIAATLADWVAFVGSRSVLRDAGPMLAALEAERGSEETLGSLVRLTAGRLLPWDVRIEQGAVSCSLWGATDSLRTVRLNETVPAGSRIESGEAQARVVAVGPSRAFARLLHDALAQPGHGCIQLTQMDRATPWALGCFACLILGIGFASYGSLTASLGTLLAVTVALTAPPARRLAARDLLRGMLEAGRRGAALRDAATFARAGLTHSLVFCARGTVLSRQIGGLDIELLAPDSSRAQVLALAAGAERELKHPVALAICKAAQERHVEPLPIRSTTVTNFGVLGELPDGQSIVVGARALCLQQNVSTAQHEARIVALEEQGSDVILVARAARVLGLLVLQQPLRVGALAAMQRLHDADVEPVLLSGGSRTRMEAIAEALDVAHVRPEVAPQDRALEVRRIAHSGGPVAVLGRLPEDAAALSASELPMVLGGAGMPMEALEGGARPPGVAFAHERLADAAELLVVAQTTRARTNATLAAGFVPSLLAVLPVAFGLIRPTYAPLAAMAATGALWIRDLLAAALPEGRRMEDT